MKTNTALLLLVSSMIIVLNGCGSTSEIKQEGKEVKGLDLSAYDCVVVHDFKDGTKDASVPEFAGRNFADRISAAVNGTSAFGKVSRESGEGRCIDISGDITRYKEGSAGLRLMIGFGAGSSYFDATVRLTDSETSQSLGEILVDKNSWALGGGIASGQTVEGFMNGAAEKIAKELAEGKQGTESPGH